MAASKIEKIKENFGKCLHRTGAGMDHWYSSGSKSLVGKDYRELDCKNCHVKGCSNCHSDPGTYEKPVIKETCLKCHTRYKTTVALDRSKGIKDVHAAMNCSDCHGLEDVHGDGQIYVSMRDPDNVKANCLDCHGEGKEGALKMNLTSTSHSVHTNLSCQACHVTNTTTCLNCHFDKFLETGSRKGTFIKAKEWVTLVNYKGQVTSGNIMSLISEGKPYVTYSPYFTHSIMKEGRSCKDCHGNEIVKKMARGEKAKVLSFKDGKIEHLIGVIPVVKDALDYDFLDLKDGQWTPLKTKNKAMITFSGYAEELTKEQLEKLKKEVD